MNEADCAACLEVALDGDSADARREAVVHLAKTPYLTKDVVLRALATVARNDSSPSVRYAAVRALAQSGAPEAAEPLIQIAASSSISRAETDPRSDDLRWAALDGLDELITLDAVAPVQLHSCRAAAENLVNRHRSRNVRVSAARLLGHFQERSALEALIEALEQRDFGVVYESERSLIHLTGQRFDHDARAWRDWLAATDDPFAGAGQRDDELFPEDPGWWDRTVAATQRTFGGFRPK